MALNIGFCLLTLLFLHVIKAEFLPNETKPVIGRLCMTVEHFRPVPDHNSSFYECATLTEAERKEYDIEGKYLGLWTKRSCSNDSVFDMARQRCVETKKFHRQQSLCARNPNSLGCQYTCAVPVYTDLEIGAPCTWQQSRLYNDPSNNNGFLQCVATSAADPCGQWSKIDCPASTTFELKIQICAPTFSKYQSGTIHPPSCSAPNEIAVCRCGASSGSCPGISVCQNEYCCATVDPSLVNDPIYQPQSHSPICIGSGTYPISSCSIPCPPQYTCQPSIGCCPTSYVVVSQTTTAAPITQAAKMILVQLTSCPDNTPPISSCGSCPPNYACAPLLGACCPVSAPATQAPQYIMVCPKTNTPSVGNCNACPPNYVCIPSISSCCPSPEPQTTTQAPASQYVILCPNTNTPPKSQTCPCSIPNYVCTPIGCCPAPEPTTTQSAPTQYQIVYCPNTNVQPSHSCPCAPQYICTPVGCCPEPATTTSAPTTQPQYFFVCPGSNSACTCSPQMICTPIGCCPQTSTTTQPPKAPIISPNYYFVCPSGPPATQQCTISNSCPPTNYCIQGACCPLKCPAQQPISAASPPACICLPNSCCCQQQVIAQPVPSLPTCSNGQIAVLACTASNQCGVGQECSSGGCCPIPFCPNGVQAAGHCSAPSTNVCQVGTVCLASEGLCCQLPQCPSGQLATSFCSSNMACPAAQQCINSGCCAVPQIQAPLCPSGIVALVPCSPTCTTLTAPDCCPANTQCVVGVGCCPQPQIQTISQPMTIVCPAGSTPVQQCVSPSNSCPPLSVCVQGVCCPQSTPTHAVQLPICPTSNQIAVATCSPRVLTCPKGTQCNTAINACCPLRLCPSGQQALQTCTNGCPTGTTCTQNLCCPVHTIQVPLCIEDQIDCESKGQLISDVMCPMQNLPICFCAPSEACPDGTTCHSGLCCPTRSVYTISPGIQCDESTQCAGYSSGAKCYENLCICIKGSYSNGASCVIQQPVIIQLAQSGCDQYGSPCKYILSSTRRRPMLSSIKNNTGDPLWFNVAGTRRCPRNLNDTTINPDNTCLPNEKCIDGECKAKLWLGEYGCESDLQCQSRCPNSYCERKSDKKVPQCQCSNGNLLLYGRCFESCPKGFHESGAYCEHDDEDLFWNNSTRQAELQSLLQSGVC